MWLDHAQELERCSTDHSCCCRPCIWLQLQRMHMPAVRFTCVVQWSHDTAQLVTWHTTAGPLTKHSFKKTLVHACLIVQQFQCSKQSNAVLVSNTVYLQLYCVPSGSHRQTVPVCDVPGQPQCLQHETVLPAVASPKWPLGLIGAASVPACTHIESWLQSCQEQMTDISNMLHQPR